MRKPDLYSDPAEEDTEVKEQRIFIEELRKIEEQMGTGINSSLNTNTGIEGTGYQYKQDLGHNKNSYSNRDLTSSDEDRIDCQLFQKHVSESDDFDIGLKDNSISYKKLRNCIEKYKVDSKNIFLGEFLSQCSKKRAVVDNWYSWTREMVDSIDANEEVMKSTLIEKGHKKVIEIMTKGNNANNPDSLNWNKTIDSKINDCIEGLKSIEDLIKTKGMSTKWGNIKYNGVILNCIKSEKSKVLRNEKKAKDIVDYVKYKKRRWEMFYKKNRESFNRSSLYK